MALRLWVDQETVKKHTNEDGDVIIRAEDVYFFKSNEICKEEGFQLECNTGLDGGFELYIPYEDFRKMYSLMSKKLMDYCIEKDM
jgi:hypothetical protein